MTDSALSGIALLIGSIALYFLPSIIAWTRHSKNHSAVVIINFFLGWTLIGWVIALAMASSGEKEVLARDLRKCPQCAERIQRDARACRYCGAKLTALIS